MTGDFFEQQDIKVRDLSIRVGTATMDSDAKHWKSNHDRQVSLKRIAENRYRRLRAGLKEARDLIVAGAPEADVMLAIDVALDQAAAYRYSSAGVTE